MYEGSMTDQYSPHDKQEPEDAESIIELTDVVASPGATNEDIIELTDVVESDVAGEDAVIELIDVVDSPPVEEPVIELTDVVAATDSDLEAAIEEIAPDPPDEELLEKEVEESTSGELAFAEMELDIEAERTDDDLFDSLGMNLEADLLPSGEDPGELDFNLSTQELSDAIDLLDAKLAEEPPKPPALEEVDIEQPSAPDSSQLEAALENVIKKLMGDKLDHLLNDAIEKTVSAEITRLKEQLLGDHPEKP
jgi:hypothetical protein